MEAFFASGFFGAAILFGPGAIIGLIVLAMASAGLRGGAAKALLTIIIALLGIAALTAASVYGLLEFYVPGAVSNCEALERLAYERGDAGIFDCEDEGLIAVFPIIMSGSAFFVFLVGALLVSVTRPKGRAVRH